MINISEVIKLISQYGDQWIIIGFGFLFFFWIASEHRIWLPWCVHHSIATDILIIFGSSMFILVPLTQFGAPGGHDFYFHVSRVAELNWLFRDGHYYARWASDFNYGFGYPLFNFYPSLIYYPAQIFRAFGAGILDSLNWVIVSGIWFSGIFMYLLGKEFWGRYGGVACAVAYIYVPYRIVNLYVRGAIPEFYAMTFMPLIFWTFYKIIRTKRLIYVVVGGISYALIIPSHNVTAIFFTICLIGYSLFLLIDDIITIGKDWKRIIQHGGYLLITAGLGIGLSAIYWLPAMYEKQFVKISSLHTEYHDVAMHFVYLSQFFSRFWGYGASGEGPRDGMSFQLGIEHLLLVVISIAVVFFLRRTYPRQHNHVIFYTVLTITLMFAMTSASLVIWRTLPLIGFISFPWRLLSLTAFALSFLCGGIFLINFDGYFSRWRETYPELSFGNRIVQFIIIGFLLLFTGGYCRVGDLLLPLPDDRLSRESLRLAKGAALNNEYLPIWVEEHRPENINGGDIQVIDGNAEIYDISTDTLSYQFTVEANTSATLRVGAVYFPGWKAYKDGELVSLEPEHPTGLLIVDIPKGKHVLKICFENTAIREIGQYITLGSLGIICGLTVLHYIKRKEYSKTRHV